MKKKRLIVAAALAAFVTGGFVGYRMVQHARYNLVTLNVTDAPLADVLARVARQTRERIVADGSLNGPVTLQVRRAPLREVLGQIADQVGGFARLNFAVGRSTAKLGSLEESLRQGNAVTPEGWTNLSAIPEPGEDGSQGAGMARHDGPPPVVGRPDELPPPPGPQSDVRMIRGGPGNSGARRIEIRAGEGNERATTRTVIVTTGDNGVTHALDLSPVRLLVESEVVSGLSLTGPSPASAEEADRLARRAGGRVSGFYSIEALPLPPGGLTPGLTELSGRLDEGGAGPRGPLAPESMEASVKRHQFDRLTRLTPEQRARSAGGQAGSGPRQVVDIEER